MIERRRRPRFPYTIPVKVYGRTPRNRPFRDVTATMAVSLHGGLLEMKPPVNSAERSHRQQLHRRRTRMPRSVCRLESPRPQAGRRRIRKIGRRFWHVYSPAVPLKTVPPCDPTGDTAA